MIVKKIDQNNKLKIINNIKKGHNQQERREIKEKKIISTYIILIYKIILTFLI